MKPILSKLTNVFLITIFALNMAHAQQAKWITADNQQANEVNTWIEFHKDFSIDKLDKKLSSVEAEIAVILEIELGEG